MSDSSDSGETEPALRTAPQPLRNPLQFLAFGFGSGLAPRGPGTAGTLAALPVYVLLAQAPLWLYTLLVLAAGLFGVWLCDVVSRQLGEHDHPGIVWDEFVGLWITLWALPVSLEWMVLGFVVFRVFDIAKPWPIGLLDRHVQGGFGIMIDDVVAGIMSCFTLHLALLLIGGAAVITT